MPAEPSIGPMAVIESDVSNKDPEAQSIDDEAEGGNSVHPNVNIVEYKDEKDDDNKCTAWLKEKWIQQAERCSPRGTFAESIRNLIFLGIILCITHIWFSESNVDARMDKFTIEAPAFRNYIWFWFANMYFLVIM